MNEGLNRGRVLVLLPLGFEEGHQIGVPVKGTAQVLGLRLKVSENPTEVRAPL